MSTIVNKFVCAIISFFLLSRSTIMNPFQSIMADCHAQDRNMHLIELEENNLPRCQLPSSNCPFTVSASLIPNCNFLLTDYNFYSHLPMCSSTTPNHCLPLHQYLDLQVSMHIGFENIQKKHSPNQLHLLPFPVCCPDFQFLSKVITNNNKNLAEVQPTPPTTTSSPAHEHPPRTADTQPPKS